jgi:Holliday junction resolvase
MSNPKYNKAKGAAFEIDVMKWLRSMGQVADRLRLAGKDDEGDLVCVVAGQTYILELKNTARLDLPEFWRQAEVEALNYAKARGIGEVPLHYVVVKRRNSGIDKAWVIQDLTQWIKEKQMPVPEGSITTSEILVPKVIEEAIVEADAEVAVEEYVAEKPAPKKRAKKI